MKILIIISFIFAFCCIYLGEVLDFYNYYWWWDIVLHFFGGWIIATALGYYVVRIVTLTPIITWVFIVSVSVNKLVLWEVFEYYVDTTLNMTMTNSFSLHDTINDLIIGYFGASIGSIAAFRYTSGYRLGYFLEDLIKFKEINHE